MKDIIAVRGAKRLQKMVAEGEHTRQDFKYAISDARKIARSLSAFANCNGGRLLIGVKDNGAIAGVRNEEDIYVVELAAHRYCHPPQKVTFTALRDGEHHVIVAEIEAAERRPVFVVESDGRHRAYFRVHDQNIAAHPLMVRAWQSDGCANFTADGIHARILAELNARGSFADARAAALALHVAEDTAAEAIAQLAAMKLVSFSFAGTAFVIIPTPPDCREL